MSEKTGVKLKEEDFASLRVPAGFSLRWKTKPRKKDEFGEINPEEEILEIFYKKKRVAIFCADSFFEDIQTGLDRLESMRNRIMTQVI